MKLVLLIMTAIVIVFGAGRSSDASRSANKNCATQNISIQANDEFATLTVSASEFQGLGSGRTSRILVKDKVMACFKDEFDFILLVRNSNSYQDFSQYNMSAITSYRPASFGSSGRLQSVTVLPAIGTVAFGATLHELAHTWCNDFLETWGYEWSQTGGTAFNSGANSRDYRSGHWGLLTPGGQLGGFDAAKLSKAGAYYTVSQSFSTHRNNNSGMYSTFELYLMGLATEREVGMVTVYENPTNITFNKIRVNFPGGRYQYQYHPKFKATPKTYTMDQIKALLKAKGAGRVPTYSRSKTFRILPVLVTSGPVSAKDRSDFNEQLRWFTHVGSDSGFVGKFTMLGSTKKVDADALKTLNNFHEATLNRGKLIIGNLKNSMR